jgi:hypothetical protein
MVFFKENLLMGCFFIIHPPGQLTELAGGQMPSHLPIQATISVQDTHTHTHNKFFSTSGNCKPRLPPHLATKLEFLATTLVLVLWSCRAKTLITAAARNGLVAQTACKASPNNTKCRLLLEHAIIYDETRI